MRTARGPSLPWSSGRRSSRVRTRGSFPDAICDSRKPRLSGVGRTRRKPHRISTMSRPASRNPITGLVSPGQTTLFQSAPQSTGSCPPRAIAAPISPPTSACDDDEGRPSRHVSRFHPIAPVSAASSTWALTNPGVVLISPPPTVCATFVDVNAPRKFITAAISDRLARAQRTRRDRGGDGVGRVMESVREVERKRDRDDDDQLGGRSTVLQVDALEHVRRALTASTACSRCSWMSFQRITTSGSWPRGRGARSRRARSGRPRPRACGCRPGGC